jgi:hypothetical protein
MIMNMKPFPSFWRVVLFSAALATAGSAEAGFQYTGQDLVLGFRQSGGISELVVNLGQASKFYTLTSGSKVTITNYDVSALSAVFPSLDALSWSVSGDVRTTDDTNHPLETLWVTRPRDDLATQTLPWARQSQYAQGAVAAKISGIGVGAMTYGNNVPTDTNNTSTLVTIPSGNPYAYSSYMGVAGNFAQSFQGDAEQTTPSGFAGGGTPLRADLYELKPGTGDGAYLGYFEFGTDGVMTYTAGASTPVIPRPTITGVTRSGTTNTISFSTVTGANYSLLATDAAGLLSAVSGWSVVGSPVAGDGSVLSVQDVSTGATRFYAIEAAP